MTTWREFWDSAHSIYVSDRHKDVHYRDVAEQVAAFVPHMDARVLDHGCGEAIHADLVANVAREVILCDAAPSVRAAHSKRRSTSANDTRMERTMSGNAMTAVASAAPPAVKASWMPKVASSQLPIGPLRPNARRRKKPTSTGGSTSGRCAIASTTALPGNFGRASA